jgi:hypothetical protein
VRAGPGRAGSPVLPSRPHDELGPFLEGVHGQPVAPGDLDRLLADERRAFDAGAQRPIWLCVGICPDLRGDTDYWARSDWTPWVRVVLPDSWLVREYWLVRQLWRALPEDPSTRPSPLVDLLVRKAKLLPVKEVERVRRWSRRNDPHYDSARDRFSIWGTSSRRTCSTCWLPRTASAVSRSPTS